MAERYCRFVGGSHDGEKTSPWMWNTARHRREARVVVPKLLKPTVYFKEPTDLELSSFKIEVETYELRTLEVHSLMPDVEAWVCDGLLEGGAVIALLKKLFELADFR